MGNVGIKKQSIEDRIMKWLENNTDVGEFDNSVKKEIRNKIKEILEDEFDNLVLY